MFDTVLVANRGEIALRIIRSVRAAGLRAVAVYSDADAHAPHVRAADAAVRVGPAAASRSYLDADAILAAARGTGAGAVHPGYGFLAESAPFAQACADAGLVFVGPPAAVIDRMGRKDEARAVAERAGVPVVPGGAIDDSGQLPAGLRLPLLVKAAAGGGGKGMRIVTTSAELEGALASARREAVAAFGNGNLIAERYVERGNHVEVQVLADAHRTVVHLLDRDCSVQRRYQKVIEEAPAPWLEPTVRDGLREAAVELAREVGYVNAGTVEFIVTGSEFFFLEMNTRLQVEHPVTEMVTGLDLVDLQLRVAAGEPLPFAQSDVRSRGHAIEARVYAEDPGHGFMPQAGQVRTVRWPAGARTDAALEAGQVVGTHYDPLLGKVIAWGATREAAGRRLRDALDDTAIVGITTNVGFLRRCVASREFAEGEIDTAWLDRHPDAFPAVPSTGALAAAAWELAVEARAPADPFARGDGFRPGGPPAPVIVELAGPTGAVRVRAEVAAGWTEVEGGVRIAVRTLARDGDHRLLELDGVGRAFHVDAGPDELVVVSEGQPHLYNRLEVTDAEAVAAGGDGLLRAPMPGTVLAIAAGAGAAVLEGEPLLVLEAMKMELTITAPFDGRVGRLAVAAGEQVDLDQLLIELESDDGE